MSSHMESLRDFPPMREEPSPSHLSPYLYTATLSISMHDTTALRQRGPPLLEATGSKRPGGFLDSLERCFPLFRLRFHNEKIYLKFSKLFFNKLLTNSKKHVILYFHNLARSLPQY